MSQACRKIELASKIMLKQNKELVDINLEQIKLLIDFSSNTESEMLKVMSEITGFEDSKLIDMVTQWQDGTMEKEENPLTNPSLLIASLSCLKKSIALTSNIAKYLPETAVVDSLSSLIREIVVNRR